MKSKELKEKFPLTYKAVQALHDTLDLCHTDIPWYKCRNINELVTMSIPYTEEEREQHFEEYLSDIKQPIWSLCEDLLSYNYETNLDQSNADNFTIMVANLELNVKQQDNIFAYTKVLPCITKGSAEAKLLKSIVYEIKSYELYGMHRDMLLSHYGV